MLLKLFIMNFLSYIKSVDYSIFQDLNLDIVNPFFDSFFPLLRDLTYFFWIFLIVYFWARKEKRLAIILTAGIIAGAVFAYPLKFLIDRQRPYEQLDTTRLLTPFENDPSFPSGHTEMSFLAAIRWGAFPNRCNRRGDNRNSYWKINFEKEFI